MKANQNFSKKFIDISSLVSLEAKFVDKHNIKTGFLNSSYIFFQQDVE